MFVRSIFFIILFIILFFAREDTSVRGLDFSTYSLAAGSSMGSYYRSGVAISTLVNMGVSDEVFDRFCFRLVKTRGSLESLELLLRGSVDFAIVDGILGYYVTRGHFLGDFEGLGDFDEIGSLLDLGGVEVRSVMSLWSSAEHFLVDKRSEGMVGVRDFLELHERGEGRYRLGLGREGSVGWLSRYFLLDKLGLLGGGGFILNGKSYSDSIESFKNGDLEVLHISSGVPNLEVSRLLQGGDFGLLDFRGSITLELLEFGGLWRPYVIESGVYGDIGEVMTISQENILVTRSDVDEKDVYLLTSLLFENFAYLEKITGSFERGEGLFEGVVPLHAGSLRYYEGSGLRISGG